MAELPDIALLAKGDAWIMHLRPWVMQRIEELRDELERGESQLVRGQLAELRTILRTVEPDLPDGEGNIYFQPAITAP